MGGLGDQCDTPKPEKSKKPLHPVPFFFADVDFKTQLDMFRSCQKIFRGCRKNILQKRIGYMFEECATADLKMGVESQSIKDMNYSLFSMLAEYRMMSTRLNSDEDAFC